MEFVNYIPDIIVGLILLGFAKSFSNWGKTVENSSAEIISKLNSLTKEVHDNMVRTENRVTRVETKVEGLEKQLHRCEIKKVVKIDKEG